MAESNGEYPTVIGPDAVFKGELSYEKGLRLMGRFEGQINTKGNLLVAEGARLQGDVDAGSIRIDGDVTGNLSTSGKIQLSASAKLEGDLQSARLEVADGATFAGRVVVGPQNGKSGKSSGSTSSSGSTGSSGSSSQSQSSDRSKNQPQPAMAGKR